MERHSARILSALLTAAVACSMLPAQGWAAQAEPQLQTPPAAVEVQAASAPTTQGELYESAKTWKFYAGEQWYRLTKSQTDKTLALLLPAGVDADALRLEWDTEKWTVNEVDGDGVLTVRPDGDGYLTLTALPAGGGAAQSLTVRFMQGSEQLPAVYLDITEGSMAEVNADATQETRASGTVTMVGADDLSGAEMELKGRGNASWNRAKKSYQIKLEDKFSVLEMGKAKKWILLPSAADLSMVRSAVGFTLEEQLEMEHATSWRFVDFYAEGEYYGVYILCEKLEVGDDRIDVTNLDDALEDSLGKDVYLSQTQGVTYSADHKTATLPDGTALDLTGGYHLELDNYTDELQFAAGGVSRITVKEPEFLGSAPKTDESYTYIRNFMDAVGDAVQGSDEAALKACVDLESFAKMWLLKQYINDYDATRNMHIWKESEVTGDGLLHAGPAWDFDNSMCRDVTDLAQVEKVAGGSTTFETGGSAKWLKQLESHPAFREELVRQYTLHQDLFTGEDSCYFSDLAGEQSQVIADSARMDTFRWGGTVFSAGVAVNEANRQRSLEVVQTFACARNGYLAGRMEDFGVTLYPVTFTDGSDTVAQLPVGAQGLQNLPAAPEKEGFSFQGWAYEENGVQKPFTPGTPVTGAMTVTALWQQDTVPVTGVALSESALTLTAGGSKALTAQVTPEQPTKAQLTWTSDKPEVAAVDAQGTVKAVAPGTANITVTVNEEGSPYGYAQAVCAVTVEKKDSGGSSGGGGGSSGGSSRPTNPPVTKPTVDEVFRDVEKTHWFFDGVTFVYEKGLMGGMETGRFAPHDSLTRGQLAQILYALADRPEGKTPDSLFADVPADMWCADAVYWAQGAGLSAGYGDGRFGVDDPITREQLAVMLYRYAQKEGQGFTGAWAFQLDFNDLEQLSDYAYESVCWCVMKGVLAGTDQGALEPQGVATRAETATMLMQFYKTLDV